MSIVILLTFACSSAAKKRRPNYQAPPFEHKLAQFGTLHNSTKMPWVKSVVNEGGSAR